MNEVKILAFGQIRDIIGRPEIYMSGVENTNEMNLKLEEMFQGISAIKYSIAVNKITVRDNTILKNGDTVALLPPFSGG